MRIDHISLRNFACFEESDLHLTPRFNLIVGDNGTGKTAWLNAIAVAAGALMNSFPYSQFAKRIQRRNARLKLIELGETLTIEPQFPVVVQCSGELDGTEVEWVRDLLNDGGRVARANQQKSLHKVGLLLAERVTAGKDAVLPVILFFGTGRLWARKEEQHPQTLQPGSRFNGYRDCFQPALHTPRLLRWFRTEEISAIQHGKAIGALEACRLAIRSCVPDSKRIFFDIKRDELMLELPNRLLPFSYLSDGFRNMVTMAADIAVRCATLNPHLAADAALQTPGIVLIDEIDLHLHPKWQRRVINDLLVAFPKIQFVATTHSPFIIQSLPPTDGVQLLNLDDPNAEDFRNKSVEDITEEVQGVELPQRSQRWMDMMKAAEEYYALLKQTDGKLPGELQELRRKLDELSLPFSDDPAYQALLKSERVAAGLNGEANQCDP